LVCSVAIAGLAVLAILASPFSGDEPEGGGKAARAAEQDSADSSGDPSGVGEGIQVHGDWVIEVRNSDGSVAERREFANALQPTGKWFLIGTLARQFSPGVWAIQLRDDEVGPFPCEGGNVVGQIPHCVIREPISSFMDSLEGVHFPTLTISTTVNDPVFELELQGNFDAVSDGSIDEVQTFQCWNSPAAVDPGTCNNIQMVTGTNLQTPVDVLAGQQVLVTVRISFS
jgi:hypothetical protein